VTGYARRRRHGRKPKITQNRTGRNPVKSVAIFATESQVIITVRINGKEFTQTWQKGADGNSAGTTDRTDFDEIAEISDTLYDALDGIDVLDLMNGLEDSE
jgi:hypothetical protein